MPISSDLVELLFICGELVTRSVTMTFVCFHQACYLYIDQTWGFSSTSPSLFRVFDNNFTHYARLGDLVHQIRRR